MSITIDEAALITWANNPNGPVAREIEFVTANDVYWIVKDVLDRPSSFTRTERGWKVWQSNPPVGPPLQRTGNLWSSVQHTRPRRDAQGVHCDITVQSTPRIRERRDGTIYLDEYPYVEHLIADGYIFVFPDDPRFTIVPRQADQ